MKNFVTKAIAISLPIILAFSIQECSSRNVPETTVPTENHEPKTTIVYEYHPDDPANPANQGGQNNQNGAPTANAENTAPNGTTANNQGQQPTEPNNQASSIPTDTAGIINYYNTALAQSSLKRTGYTRTLTQCKVSLLGDKTNEAKPLVAASATPAGASDLVPLNTSMVSNATSSVSGNNVTLTITLNNSTGKSSLKNGDNGYVGIIEYEEIGTLVNSIANAALSMDAKLESISAYNTTNGKYTVVIDNGTGKITSVNFSGSESGTGKAKKGVSVTVEIAIDLTATYTP